MRPETDTSTPPRDGAPAPAGAAAPARLLSPWRTVYLPSAFLLVVMLNLTLIVAGAKELFVDALGGSTRDVSLFFSIEMAAYIVFAPLWGVVSDRLRTRRPLIAAGFAVSGLLYLSYTAVDSIPVLLGLRFLQGMAAVAGWSTLMAMVLDHPDRGRRGRYMGIMGGALILGVSLGAPLGGYLSRDLGPRAPLFAAALLFLTLAVGTLSLADPPGVTRLSSLGRLGSALAASRRLLLPYLFHFVDRFTVAFFVVHFPLYLGTLGVDPAVRGRYLSLFLLPFALLQPVAGRLTDRLGPYRPLLIGSLLYGVLLCTVGYADLFSLWWVMAGLGVLASVMFPPAIALTAQLSDASIRGSAMGGFNLAGSLGFAVGPLVGEWVYESWGYGSVFITGGVLEIVAAAAAAVLFTRWAVWGGEAEPGG